MARDTGRNGKLYLALTSGTAATPFALLTDWSMNKTVDHLDATAMGDPNKQYVSGIPDASGDFSYWVDDASAQAYAAAVDGLPRAFYLYPDLTNQPTNYWCGYMLPDMSETGSVGGVISGKSTWAAGGRVDRYRAGVVG